MVKNIWLFHFLRRGMANRVGYFTLNSDDSRSKEYGFGFSTLYHLLKILKILLRKRSSVILVILLAVLSFIEQFIIYYVGIIPSGYYEVLGNKNLEGFWRQTFESVALIFAVCFVLSSKLYLVNAVYVYWRELLTENIQILYFKSKNFFILNTMNYFTIDNPDQRITQDVEKFCKQMSSVFSPLIVAPFTISYYSYFCYKASGWFGPLGIFGFFVLSAVINKLLIKQIVRFVVAQEKCEGFFRFKHMHVRSNAESIAFQDAGPAELFRTEHHLKKLISTQQTLYVRQFPLDIAVKLFDYAGSIVSYVILAAAIFSGKYSNIPSVEISAIISKNSFVSIYLISCFSSLVDLSSNLSQIGGLTHRISELLEALEDSDSTMCSKMEDDEMDVAKRADADAKVMADGAVISLENVTFCAPCSTTPLVINLSLKISYGLNILVTGHSSSGKTSLLRVIKGLWPISAGRIETAVPLNPSLVFFLPQKPVLTDGTLMEQILYPLQPSHYLETSSIDTELIKSYLHFADLEHILSKAGLEKEVGWNWYDVLSPGEAQRLSFVRLFYHRPLLAFLDETTSALGQEMERKLYKKCNDLSITLVSVGHRSSLFQYHDYNLHLQGSGKWSFNKISTIN